MLLAGLLESTPAILQWFLEHQATSFPESTAGSLWRFLDGLVSLLYSKSPSPAGLLSIFSVSRQYQQYFSSPAAAGKHSPKVVSLLLLSVAQCQFTATSQLYELLKDENVPPRDPALQRLVLTPCVVDTALLKVASSCHFLQQQRQQEQQKQAGGVPLMTSSSSSRQSAGRFRQETSSSNGTNGRSSRSSSTSIQAPPVAASPGVPATFSKLVVPHDHEAAGVALGNAAFAVDAKLVSDVAAATAAAGRTSSVMGAYGLYSVYVLHASSAAAAAAAAIPRQIEGSSGSQAPCSPQSLASPVYMQLLLEMVALAGADVEDGILRPYVFRKMLHAFNRALLNLSPDDQAAFIALRGSLLLQVFSLTLRVIQQPEWHDQLSYGVLSQIAVTLAICSGAPGEGR